MTQSPGQQPKPPDLPPWRPLAGRTRGLLGVLAVVLAVVLGWLMLQPKLRLMAAREARGEAPVPIGLPTELHRARGVGLPPDRPPCASAGGASTSAGPRAAGPVDGACVGGTMPVRVLPAAGAGASPGRP